MKKITLSSIFVALLVSHTALAGYGNMIQIENDSDQTYYPWWLSAHCLSEIDNWPSSVPAHTKSSYVYVEVKKAHPCHARGNLLISFTSEDKKNFFETRLLIYRSDVFPDPATVSNAYSFINSGILSRDWDYVTLLIK